MRWPTLRELMTYCLIGGGMALTAFAAVLVWIIWKGGWPLESFGQRLDILGLALLTTLGGAITSLIFIGIGGPIKKVDGGVGPAHISVEGDE